jgi:hypothetical protein
MSGISKKGTSGPAEIQRVITRIKSEFPDFKIVKKTESPLMLKIDKLLRFLSFGRMTNFMTGFVTTIGHTVYVADNWDSGRDLSKSVILRHEAVHMRQLRRMGWLWFVYSYLFCPLPVGFCYGRTKLEREAYEETIRAAAEYYGLRYILDPKFKALTVSYFTGPDYLWMWPFRESCESWYDRTAQSVKLALEKEYAEEGQYL